MQHPTTTASLRSRYSFRCYLGMFSNNDNISYPETQQQSRYFFLTLFCDLWTLSLRQRAAVNDHLKKDERSRRVFIHVMIFCTREGVLKKGDTVLPLFQTVSNPNGRPAHASPPRVCATVCAPKRCRRLKKSAALEAKLQQDWKR